MKVLISLGCTGGARKGFGSLGLPRCCMDHLGTRPHTCRCNRNVVGEALGRQGAGATTGSSCVYILGEQPALTSVQRPAGICCPSPGLNMTRKKKIIKKCSLECINGFLPLFARLAFPPWAEGLRAMPRAGFAPKHRLSSRTAAPLHPWAS